MPYDPSRMEKADRGTEQRSHSEYEPHKPESIPDHNSERDRSSQLFADSYNLPKAGEIKPQDQDLAAKLAADATLWGTQSGAMSATTTAADLIRVSHDAIKNDTEIAALIKQARTNGDDESVMAEANKLLAKTSPGVQFRRTSLGGDILGNVDKDSKFLAGFYIVGAEHDRIGSRRD